MLDCLNDIFSPVTLCIAFLQSAKKVAFPPTNRDLLGKPGICPVSGLVPAKNCEKRSLKKEKWTSLLFLQTVRNSLTGSSLFPTVVL